MRNRLTRQVLRQPLAFPSLQATDAQLCFWYAQLGNASAFEELMRRHGSMVWGVCRRLLRCVQDAEDAFQATFLVLARKAGSLRDTQRLPAWLHGVARRTALHMRSRRRDTLPLNETQVLADDNLAWEWHEYRGMLDDAIARLPVRLRTAFLLCHAEGLTAALTAKRMNIPEGTVVSRVHRARVLLRRYLQRRGVTSAAGAVGATVSLALPEALAGQTLRSVMGTSTSAVVCALAQGVMVTMTWIKMTTAAVVVGALGLSGAGAALVWAGQDRERPGKQEQERGRDRLTELEAQLKRLREQVDQARAQEAAARVNAERAEVERQTALVRLKQVQEEMEKHKNAAVQQRDQLAQAFQEMNQRRTQEQQTEEKTKARQAESQKRFEMARERLQAEVDQLRREMIELGSKHPHIHRGESHVLNHLTTLKTQQLNEEDVLRRYLAMSKNTNDPKVKERIDQARATISAMNTQIKEASETDLEYNVVLQRYEHLKGRLKLREKLLLEVEERLLRAQLGLP